MKGIKKAGLTALIAAAACSQPMDKGVRTGKVTGSCGYDGLAVRTETGTYGINPEIIRGTKKSLGEGDSIRFMGRLKEPGELEEAVHVLTLDVIGDADTVKEECRIHENKGYKTVNLPYVERAQVKFLTTGQTPP